MKLLLTSMGHELVGELVSGRIAYVSDAARSFADLPEHAEWVNVERDMLRAAGLEIVELPLAETSPQETDRILSEVDAVYVAGGETFDLLWVLRSTGNDEVLLRHVRAGLTYVGCSAGSVIAGPSIEPVSLLDSPSKAPELTDYTGLGLTEHVVIPHAGGTAPPFPIEVFAETVRQYGEAWPLVLLRDGQALLIDDTGTRLV
ncbi:Type 1 glutamine amidotransferase-like domain-containing protein [Corynebacterium doosanense]|uniref:Peptidase n=1 Tax=Corynebacterium doosanense CAU 212 = DSM 45436 TaxID=558173 RepID=A0A097IDN9_9CORY|nr:Type 1 glutamine amidotransferase-like domain-containing protein [Corynebacterium doosanense]AIT60258.1 peptidase [Corynebacterium doosanense CAU 212 = DSM 45436]